jgi:glyoxylase-like metal-dependent hydrolase (beta-lactamase superfamily II)
MISKTPSISPSLILLASVLFAGPVACPDSQPSPEPGSEAIMPGRKTADLRTFGRGQTEPYRVADSVYQAHGVGNTNFVVTPAGNVVIDAGLPATAKAHKQLLQTADDGPVRYVIVTHAHLDHGGGANTWMEEGAEILAHRTFPETQRYLTELLPFFTRKNRVFYPDSVPEVPGWASPILRRLYPQVEPSILVDEEYAFELAGVRFEVIHTPGAEGEDSISVWLPDRKILFSGDLFGPCASRFPTWHPWSA